MKLSRIFYAFLFVVIASQICPAQDRAPGAAVESVEKGSSGEKAGILPGDVLLSWARKPDPEERSKGAKGSIGAPFDYVNFEIEELPRGKVTVYAKRDNNKVSFELSGGATGISIRPNFGGSFLAGRYIEAVNCVSRKETDNGVDQLVKLADELMKSRDPHASCWLYLKAGEILAKERKRDAALGLFEKAGAANEVLRNKTAEWKISLSMGDTLKGKNEFAKAVACYEKAAAISEKGAGECLMTAVALNKLGIMANIMGDLKGAEEFYKRALAINEKIAPGSLEVASNLTNLGVIERKKGDLQGAARCYERALAINERLAPESIAVASTLTNMGVLALDKGDLAGAEDFYDRALEIREKLAPGSLEVAGALNNLGIVAARRGDLSGTREFFRKALAIREKVAPDSLAVSDTLNNIGSVELGRGDLESAEELFERSLKIREKLAPESLDVATILSNLGNIELTRGDLAASQELLNRALKIREKLAPESLDIATSLNNLGNVALTKGDFKSAEEFYQGALTIGEKLAPESLLAADSLNNLGNVARSKEDFKSAEDFLKRSLALRDKLTPKSLVTAVILDNLGTVVMDGGDLKSADGYFQSALKIAEAIAPGSMDEAEVLHNLGELAIKNNDPEEALRYLQRTVDAFEKQAFRLGGGRETGERFSAKYADYYRDLIGMQVRLDRRDDALNTLERFRAKSLLEMLAERDLDFTKDAPLELLKERKELAFKYGKIQDELSGLSLEKNNEDITALLTEAGDLKRRQEENAEKIRRSSPKLASLQYPESLNSSEMTKLFAKDALFISYSTAVSQTTLFALLNGSLDVYTIPVERSRLTAEVSLFRKLLTDPESDPKLLTERSRQLFDLLLKPAEKQIKRSGLIMICPDGPLHYLPFSALLTGKKKYLISSRPVVYEISATVLNELSKRPAAGTGKLAAFGNPVYPGEEFKDAAIRYITKGRPLSPLPATELEVDSIADIFHDMASTYKKEKATEENARGAAKDASIIHFACHGFLDERFPLNSGLALTIPKKPEQGKENGLLQAWEIFEQIRMDADLVTLSACETGLGKEMGGEGLIGLTRAFQYAGARTVLSSLWSVSDESTALLMKSFYSNLKAGKNKAEALRLAQNEMAGSLRYSHPFYWAGFVLNGDCN